MTPYTLQHPIMVVRNDYHKTETRFRPNRDGRITNATAARIRAKLCPVKNCPCTSSDLGVRGRQAYARFEAIPLSDNLHYSISYVTFE